MFTVHAICDKMIWRIFIPQIQLKKEEPGLRVIVFRNSCIHFYALTFQKGWLLYLALHKHLVSHLISSGLLCSLRRFNEKFAIMHYIEQYVIQYKAEELGRQEKKISLRIRGGACYQLFSGTQRDPTCRTLLIGLEWKSLKNWPLGGARIYKREGASHLTATVKNSWFRSSLLQTGQLAK